MGINRLINKGVSTIKNEGVKSFSKKTANYLKIRLHRQNLYYYSDVLFINGCSLPHPFRYRVEHQVEQLNASGFYANWKNDNEITLDMVKYYRCFVFFRCPITPLIEEFIKKAKEENKIVFYDIDDLVIDSKYTKTIKYLKTLSKEEKELYDDGVNRMQQTLKLCDYAITTTSRLQKELSNYVKEVFINKNVASEEMAKLSKKALSKKKDLIDKDYVTLAYLSGSITHNADVDLIKPILTKLMKKYKNTKLLLMGEISIPDEFKEFEDRLIFKDFTSWENLPEIIAGVDINLAPLETSIFNEAKSENRWMEAGLVETVTIASDVGAFHDAINDGVDGVLCKNSKDWEEKLEKLITDEDYRKNLAKNAKTRVYKEYITTYTGHNLSKFIKSKLNKNIAFILPTTNISGGVNVITKHIAILKKHNYDVCVINMDNNNDDMESRWGKISVLKEHKTGFAGHFDSVVATLYTTLDFAYELKNVTNRLYLVQNYETEFNEFGNYFRLLANATYEDDTNVKYLTISKWCQNWLKDQFEKPCKYAPNGIDLNQFQFKKRDFNGKIKILVEGNSDDYYKNVDESFKIVDKLDKDKYEIHFLSYQGKPKEWYYVDKFMHKVPYKDVGKVYQDADILIKSSIVESFSYPPLEMMATGGLVVVTPNGGNIEYIKDNVNCLFYETGNIDEAVEKIELLTKDKKLRDKLIKNGLEMAKYRDWNNIEEDILNLYR